MFLVLVSMSIDFNALPIAVSSDLNTEQWSGIFHCVAFLIVLPSIVKAPLSAFPNLSLFPSVYILIAFFGIYDV